MAHLVHYRMNLEVKLLSIFPVVRLLQLLHFKAFVFRFFIVRSDTRFEVSPPCREDYRMLGSLGFRLLI